MIFLCPKKTKFKKELMTRSKNVKFSMNKHAEKERKKKS